MSGEDKLSTNDADPKEGEVLPPSPGEGDVPPQVLAQIAAQITQYTERPDLLLETLEKHVPGFIKDMVKRAKDQADKDNKIRFKFGKHQAYTGIAMSVITGLTIVGGTIYAISIGRDGFWLVIAMAIFYAISQGGGIGFSKIVAGIEGLIRRLKNNNTHDD